MMKKNSLIIILLSIICFVACNQKANNEQEIKLNKSKINNQSTALTSSYFLSKDSRWFYDLAKENITIGNPDKAILYADELIRRSQEEKDKNGEALGFYIKGYVYDMQKSMYDEALPNYYRAWGIRDTLHHKQINECLLGIASSYYKLGFFDKALYYYKQLLENAQKINNLSDQATAYRNMGLVYDQFKNDKEAILSFQKALAIYTELNQEKEIAAVYNGIGSFYLVRNKYTDAKEYYLKAFSHLTKTETQELADVQFNLGLVHKEMGEHSIAINYFTQSLELSKKLKYDNLTKRCHIELSMVYSFQRKYNYSITELDLAKKIAEYQKDFASLTAIDQLCSEKYEATGNSFKALAYLKESNKWKDTYQTQQASLHDQLEDQRLAVIDWQASLEPAKKTSAPIKGWLITIGIFIFLLASSYFLRSIIQKKKESKKNTNQETEPGKFSLHRWQSYQLSGIQKQLVHVKRLIECLEENSEKDNPLVVDLKRHVKQISWYSHLSDERKPPTS